MSIQWQDQENMAFWSCYGHFELKVVMFWLTNAPPQFMVMMNDVLGDKLGKACVTYLDNIVVYIKTKEEDAKALKKVLTNLRYWTPPSTSTKLESLPIIYSSTLWLWYHWWGLYLGFWSLYEILSWNLCQDKLLSSHFVFTSFREQTIGFNSLE